MKKTPDNKLVLSDEVVISKIYQVRGKKIMLDKDLAGLYQLETKQLKRQVRRNIERFPEDFMFEITKLEFDNLRSQIDTSSWGGTRYLPMVFTEQGVAMLSSILSSKTAIQVNIKIMRIFTKMHMLIETYQEVISNLEDIERKNTEQDDKIMLIFEYLNQFEEAKKQELELKSRKRIGYKRKEEQ